MRITKPKLLRYALQNTRQDSGASEEYARGIVVGIVSTLMAGGMSWDKAFQAMRDSLPRDYRLSTIPDSWLEMESEHGESP